HGQTTVERTAQLQTPFAGLEHDVVVTASNRSGQLYLRRTALVDAGTLAERLDGEPSVEATLRREGDAAVARRAGEELRFRPDGDGWATTGDATILDHPDAPARTWAPLANPNSGELLDSAADAW